MTINEIAESKELFIEAEDVAPILGVDAQSIRAEAGRDVCRLGFPIIRIGNKTKIPRKPFLRFVGAEERIGA